MTVPDGVSSPSASTLLKWWHIGPLLFVLFARLGFLYNLAPLSEPPESVYIKLLLSNQLYPILVPNISSFLLGSVIVIEFAVAARESTHAHKYPF